MDKNKKTTKSSTENKRAGSGKKTGHWTPHGSN